MYVFFNAIFLTQENRSEGPGRSFPSSHYHRQHRLTQRSSRSINVDQNRTLAKHYPAWVHCLDIFKLGPALPRKWKD